MWDLSVLVSLYNSNSFIHIKESRYREICPAIYASVCGSNGRTYANNCSLEVDAFKTRQDITFVHNGHCSKY